MTKRTFALTLAVLVVVLLAVGGYYAFSRDTFEAGTASVGGELSEKEVAKLLEDVGTHIKLPQDEAPVIATIVDVEALATTQLFYQDAENGDILLIYPQTSKAIIYSPSRDIIVNVGPIIFDGETEATQVVDTSDEEDL